MTQLQEGMFLKAREKIGSMHKAHKTRVITFNILKGPRLIQGSFRKRENFMVSL